MTMTTDVIEESNGLTANAVGKSTRPLGRLAGSIPRLSYVNKRYIEDDEEWRLTTRRTRQTASIEACRRNKTSRAVCVSQILDVAEISEDEETISGPVNGESVIEMIEVLSNIVTHLVDKLRYANKVEPEISDNEEKEDRKPAYFTRASSVTKSSDENHNVHYFHFEKGINGVFCSLKDLYNIFTRINSGKCHIDSSKGKELISYLLMEYIAIRSEYYRKILNNLESLLQYAKQYSKIPYDFVTCLKCLYYRTALMHLEYLRHLIPSKVRKAGVLDLRMWKIDQKEQALVTMDDINNLLLKYNCDYILKPQDSTENYYAPAAVKKSPTTTDLQDMTFVRASSTDENFTNVSVEDAEEKQIPLTNIFKNEQLVSDDTSVKTTEVEQSNFCALEKSDKNSLGVCKQESSVPVYHVPPLERVKGTAPQLPVKVTPGLKAREITQNLAPKRRIIEKRRPIQVTPIFQRNTESTVDYLKIPKRKPVMGTPVAGKVEESTNRNPPTDGLKASEQTPECGAMREAMHFGYRAKTFSNTSPTLPCDDSDTGSLSSLDSIGTESK